MRSKIAFTILFCVCAALPIAAQTAAIEGMVLVPAGKFWLGRSYTIFLNSADLLARDRMDDIPANNIQLDAFYIDKYEVTNADYAKFVAATGTRAPWHWPQGQIPKGEKSFLLQMLIGLKPTTTANGLVSGCLRKQSLKRLHAADSTETTIRGATPTSTMGKRVC